MEGLSRLSAEQPSTASGDGLSPVLFRIEPSAAELPEMLVTSPAFLSSAPEIAKSGESHALALIEISLMSCRPGLLGDEYNRHTSRNTRFSTSDSD